MNEWQQKRRRGSVGGLYSKGMHEFVVRECEVGFRVAVAEDGERTGFGPLFDLSYALYVAAQG